ncbi:MAG: response regulator [Bryobacteraceae bacterium]
MLRILVAEDNPADVFLIQRALKQHDIEHELHLVRDGAEALEFVAKMGSPGGSPCPDVVLLDMNLPMVDGLEVLRQLRTRPGFGDTPVIVVTSSDAPTDRARMAELGIARYFRKPTDFKAFLELGAIVREVTAHQAR